MANLMGTIILPILLFLPGEHCGLFRKPSSITTILAEGNITCFHHHPVWCYSAVLIEKDWLHDTDDILDTNGAWCRYTDTEPYRLVGEDDGDGLNDNFYEFSIEITHNCSRSGEILRLTKHLKPITVQSRLVLIDTSVEVTHIGRKVDDYWSHG